MSVIIGLIGLVFSVAGFLSLVKLTDYALNLVMLTQIHTLPLLNAVNPNWVYLGFGILLLVVAGAMQGGRRLVVARAV